MKRVIVLIAVAVAIAWCAIGFANVQSEIERAQALAAGTYPLEFEPRSASSGYSLIVESVTIQPGATGTVGLYLTNDQPLSGINIPLIIRSVDVGSYMTHMTPAFNGSSRLNHYLDGEFDDTVYVKPIINTYPYYTPVASNGRYGWQPPRLLNPPAPPDYISPDGLLFARFRILPENDLPAGSDGVPGYGIPMITVEFTVNDTPGRFEIDTCFTEPSHHLVFILSGVRASAVSPDFTKGIVTIAGERTTVSYEDTVSAGPPDVTAEDSVIVETPADTSVVNDPVVVELPVDTTPANDPVVVIVDPPGDTIPPLDSLVFDPPVDSSWVSEDDGGKTRDPYLAEAKAPPVSNYPNPFNAGTSIRYSLDGTRHVMVEVYDLLGRRVITLVDAHQPPGEYTVPWDGRDTHGNSVGAGIYFYRVQKGDFQTVGKMVLLK